MTRKAAIAPLLASTLVMLSITGEAVPERWSSGAVGAGSDVKTPLVDRVPRNTDVPYTLVASRRFKDLLWADEFSGHAGSPPNPEIWTHEIGGNGWGNEELQYYTNRKENAHHNGKGQLVIRAKQEKYTGPDGVTRDYTSARLITKGKRTIKYGRIEVRAKLPYGRGLWPAIWSLGTNIDSVGWPASGEIDIMENLGHDTYTLYGTIHGPRLSGGKYTLGASYKSPTSFSEGFNTYSVRWSPDTIRFYVNGNLYSFLSAQQLSEGDIWVFNEPFYLILNVAVGGNWPGRPDSSTLFPQDMLIDYVRVFAR